MSRPKLVSHPPLDRRAQLAKIHVAKKQLGMTDSDYRGLLSAITGKTSAADCNETELVSVLDRLKQAGFKPVAKAPGGKAHVGLVNRLWATLGETGTLTDSSEAALRAFVQRQCGVTAPQFLNPKQAEKVIEGLKAWLARVKGTAKC